MSAKWRELFETIKYKKNNKLVLEIIDIINIMNLNN
jgi:hypothetical protein